MTCADLFMFIRKRSEIITLTGMLACFIVVAGCGKQSPSVGTTPGAPPEVGVDVVKPQRVVLMTELSGRTSAYLIAEVRPQVSGIIQKRLFTEGADVKAGELLYQIDPATYQAAYNSAKAALVRAEANVGPARLKAERYQELVAINAVSQQDFRNP